MSSSSNRENPDQIPGKDNQDRTEQTIQRQNQVSGEQREKNVSNLPKAATIGQVLKDMTFPADKNTIVRFIEQSNRPEGREILPVIQNLEDRQYRNVSEVTNAAGLAQ